jgi:putative intracellular protease/amidase
MAANHNNARLHRILAIVANPVTSPTTGWPTGFWWSELTHAYWAFTEAGYEVDIASPRGGPVTADAYSDPEHESRYSAHDLLSLGFKKSPAHAKLLEQTPSVHDVDLRRYDAIFVAGGQSPMIDMFEDKRFHQFLAGAYEAGKVLALVCHGTCVLLKVRLSSGELLVKDRTWTGFATSEEKIGEAAVGMKIQPFYIEDEARKLRDTNFVVQAAARPHAVRDGRLITGQQHFSAGVTAQLVIETLGR